MNNDAIMQNGDISLLYQLAIFIPARRFPNDIVGLPFTGRFRGIHQRRLLAVDRRGLPIGICRVIVGIEDLNLVAAINEQSIIATALSLAFDFGGLSKFVVQL